MNSLHGRRTLRGAPLDLDALLARCMGNCNLVEKLLGRFQQVLDDDLDQLEEAFRAASAEEIRRVAHRMKGSSLTMGATGIKECALRLETCAEQGQLDDVEECLAELKLERSMLDDLISDRRCAQG